VVEVEQMVQVLVVKLEEVVIHRLQTRLKVMLEVHNLAVQILEPAVELLVVEVLVSAGGSGVPNSSHQHCPRCWTCSRCRCTNYQLQGLISNICWRRRRCCWRWSRRKWWHRRCWRWCSPASGAGGGTANTGGGGGGARYS
jgi:hypothetical protein